MDRERQHRRTGRQPRLNRRRNDHAPDLDGRGRLDQWRAGGAGRSGQRAARLRGVDVPPQRRPILVGGELGLARPGVRVVAGDQRRVGLDQRLFDRLGRHRTELGERGDALRLEGVGILRPDAVEDRQVVAGCDLGRLDGRNGGLDLGDSLFGHLVDLGAPTEIGELGGDVDRHGRVHEHAHRGLTGGELAGDPVAVRGLEAEALVMEGTQQPAADHAGEEGRRGDHRQHEADPGALADAALAELVGLDLALVVEGEDADRIELERFVRLVPGLQRFDRVVGGRLVLEECQDHCLACHVQPSVRLMPPAMGTKPQTPGDECQRSRGLVPEGRRPGRSRSPGSRRTGSSLDPFEASR